MSYNKTYLMQPNWVKIKNVERILKDKHASAYSKTRENIEKHLKVDFVNVYKYT